MTLAFELTILYNSKSVIKMKPQIGVRYQFKKNFFYFLYCSFSFFFGLWPSFKYVFIGIWPMCVTPGLVQALHKISPYCQQTSNLCRSCAKNISSNSVPGIYSSISPLNNLPFLVNLQAVLCI